MTVTDDRWIALHVFYASDSNPVLTDAVRPLVAELRREDLLERWFFIKYWMEGPHVRLRLLPRRAEDRARVQAIAEERLAAFLRRRPALYEVDADGTSEVYKKLFLAEYSEEEYEERYGDGHMPFRPNNSVHSFPYELEFDRYGGPEGMELAQWHFEHSSDVVLELLASTNVHVRTVMLGLSVQLSLALCYVFLDTDEEVTRFLAWYQSFWETTYQERPEDYHDGFRRNYLRMEDRLVERVERVRAAANEDPDELTPLERRWITHARELRQRVEALQEAGRLEFVKRDGSGERGPLEDASMVRFILLSSYVHMTSNRLGVSILDEIYLCFVLQLAYERLAGPAEPGEVAGEVEAGEAEAVLEAAAAGGSER